MNRLQHFEDSGYRYHHIIGAGGIGSGIFFSMCGNDTLGRNESRMASLLPYQDYCKQHIIMHYIAMLLGASIVGDFQAFPIGRVGDDAPGHSLLKMMEQAGMDITHVKIDSSAGTLFSVCFQYPDSSGGNITTSQSASSRVESADVDDFFQNFSLTGNAGIVLAVPEAPLESRLNLLAHGRKRGCFTVTSILSSESEKFLELGGVQMTDLISINMDEARRLSSLHNENADSNKVFENCVNTLTALNPAISILISDGMNGCRIYSNNRTERIPSLSVTPVSTAGAGDALLAGTICGLCCGLPLIKGNSDAAFSATPLRSAVELGTLLAAFSVTAADTIHPAVSVKNLFEFATKNSVSFSDEWLTVFAKK